MPIGQATGIHVFDLQRVLACDFPDNKDWEWKFHPSGYFRKLPDHGLLWKWTSKDLHSAVDSLEKGTLTIVPRFAVSMGYFWNSFMTD
jgi:hypothetical protein